MTVVKVLDNVNVSERVEQVTQRFLPGLAKRPGGSADPSARMFSRIRLRLTFWYSAILAVMLILAGLVLYTVMTHVLLDPIGGILQAEAQQEAQGWQQQDFPPPQCAEFVRGQQYYYYVACFDANGNPISVNPFAHATPAFVSTSVAQAALNDPSSPITDSVTTTVPVTPPQQGASPNDDQPANQSASRPVNQPATIMRYTYVVRDPAGQQALGVVQVGLPITNYANSLSLLLKILLAVGAATLLGSAAGGILLAHRALAPARLSFERQQQFIADASHELRTPLTLMRADAEVLLRGRERLDPDDAPLLDDIVTETEHMGTIAENLLTLARLDAGVYHIEQEVVDLSELAARVARRARTLADERQITLVADQLEKALAIGDSTWLSEVALVLVDNAIKYNRPGGSVMLRTFRHGGSSVLEVRDTGIGIAAEHLEHLGERFYRVDKARARQMGGAGLGLSIARGIAAQHHGTLTLTSVPNQGTTATLRLPAATITGPHP